MSGPLKPWLFLAARSAPLKPFAAATVRIPNITPHSQMSGIPSCRFSGQPPAPQFVFWFVGKSFVSVGDGISAANHAQACYGGSAKVDFVL
jgi:hypothetical protein